jgi:hypothetical protein
MIQYPHRILISPVLACSNVHDDEEVIITAGDRAIRLLTIPNRHATGMLMPYIEAVSLVLVSDYCNPERFFERIPPQFSFWREYLLDALESLQLNIQ